jgi:hypothetical protein
MTGWNPFAYPAKAHERRHAPAGYANYRYYKPWLRDEFVFRCVYCLERERWYPNREAAFSVDHVVPQVDDPSRVCDYENMVYACMRCNSNKTDILLPDPNRVNFAECLSIADDGTISPLNAYGADLIDLLHLDDPLVINTRKKYMRVVKLKIDLPKNPDVEDLFLDAFGYPDNLPDLASMKPPGGNRSASGTAPSYFELRRRNRLDETY